MPASPVPVVLTSPPLPYYEHTLAVPKAAPGTDAAVPPPMFYGVTGFRIPSLAVVPTGYSQQPEMLVQQILYRFQRYVRELHVPGSRRSVALQLMAHPERSTFGSQVGMYVLCRTAEETREMAAATAERAGMHALGHFPQEGLFSYGTPCWLPEAELRRALFMPDAIPEADLVELRKYQERQVWDRLTQTDYMQYVPHRFWADTQMDPWLVLIENLSRATQAVAVRIEIIPTRAEDSAALEELATAARWFGLVDEDIQRTASKPDIEVQDAKTGEFKEEGLRTETKLALASASRIAYVKRGKHIYEKLLENADQLFSVRVIIAAEHEVPDTIVQSVRTALSTPPPNTHDIAMGWIRPEVVRPKPTLADRGPALRQLNWMAQNRWAREELPECWYGPDLRSLTTAEEVSSLFHLPIAEKAGKTSALSTSETPFVIPPEVLDTSRFGATEPRVRAGYLYQRETLLSPANVGEQAQAFSMPLKRMMMPSLLVGAPGSGKSNMALYLLLQLWRDHKMPFLVLDPSTGQEYRLLLGSRMNTENGLPPADHESDLCDHFIVFTVGDNEGCPLRFNPFCVPPGVTVRSHITRLMAAFKSAYSMPDPFPAVFESALQRLYTSEKYSGGGRPWSLDEKGGKDGVFPCLADFAVAMNDELEENVLPGYKGSGEATGVLKGGTSIRIDSLYKNLGHVLNVRKTDPEFFQHVLRRPCVIELGAVGDTTNIALVMAFLLTQLVGHVEHAFNEMRDEGHERLHLLLIEEAHRLLSGEGGDSARGKSAEDLSVMLAECRKFGQGIMILDQRPSSLVGGVLDNANIKILTRLSDRHGFERLAMELNLTEDQQRHARTRLAPGEAVMLDWKSGQPVLIRCANVSDGLREGRLPKEAEREQMLRNAERWKVLSPPAEPYLREKPAATASTATPAAAPRTETQLTLRTRRWLAPGTEALNAELEKLVIEARNNSRIYYDAVSRIKEADGDPAAASRLLHDEMKALQPRFQKLAAALWVNTVEAALGVVVEENEQRGELQGVSEKVRTRMQQLQSAAAAGSQPSGQPADRTGSAASTPNAPAAKSADQPATAPAPAGATSNGSAIGATAPGGKPSPAV